MLTGDLNICDLEEGRLCGTRQTLTNGDRTNQRVQGCLPTHPGVGSTRLHPEGRRPWPHENSLSRIDRAFINIPLSEPKDIRYLASVVRDSTLLSDLIPMRLYIEQTGAPPSIRTWRPYTMPNRYDADLFCALEQFKVLSFHGTRSYPRGNSSEDADFAR